eukprot:TRINITY_DN18718_c2_g1_i1.p1 TRINITY_DN18718_c2_g1~~TRINITY_DN18718_c2_g1_i1.p1  ORF type:complete len:1037 (+),score=155.06 TRINITY_DN18718_c2_g1_i1:142-3252(+)
MCYFLANRTKEDPSVDLLTRVVRQLYADLSVPRSLHLLKSLIRETWRVAIPRASTMHKCFHPHTSKGASFLEQLVTDPFFIGTLGLKILSPTDDKSLVHRIIMFTLKPDGETLQGIDDNGSFSLVDADVSGVFTSHHKEHDITRTQLISQATVWTDWAMGDFKFSLAKDQWSQPITYTPNFMEAIKEELGRDASIEDMVLAKEGQQLTVESLRNLVGADLKAKFPLKVRLAKATDEGTEAKVEPEQVKSPGKHVKGLADFVDHFIRVILAKEDFADIQMLLSFAFKCIEQTPWVNGFKDVETGEFQPHAFTPIASLILNHILGRIMEDVATSSRMSLFRLCIKRQVAKNYKEMVESQEAKTTAGGTKKGVKMPRGELDDNIEVLEERVVWNCQALGKFLQRVVHSELYQQHFEKYKSAELKEPAQTTTCSHVLKDVACRALQDMLLKQKPGQRPVYAEDSTQQQLAEDLYATHFSLAKTTVSLSTFDLLELTNLCWRFRPRSEADSKGDMSNVPIAVAKGDSVALDTENALVKTGISSAQAREILMNDRLCKLVADLVPSKYVDEEWSAKIEYSEDWQKEVYKTLSRQPADEDYIRTSKRDVMTLVIFEAQNKKRLRAQFPIEVKIIKVSKVEFSRTNELWFASKHGEWHNFTIPARFLEFRRDEEDEPVYCQKTEAPMPRSICCAEQKMRSGNNLVKKLANHEENGFHATLSGGGRVLAFRELEEVFGLLAGHSTDGGGGVRYQIQHDSWDELRRQFVDFQFSIRQDLKEGNLPDNYRKYVVQLEEAKEIIDQILAHSLHIRNQHLDKDAPENKVTEEDFRRYCDTSMENQAKYYGDLINFKLVVEAVRAKRQEYAAQLKQQIDYLRDVANVTKFCDLPDLYGDMAQQRSESIAFLRLKKLKQKMMKKRQKPELMMLQPSGNAEEKEETMFMPMRAYKLKELVAKGVIIYVNPILDKHMRRQIVVNFRYQDEGFVITIESKEHQLKELIITREAICRMETSQKTVELPFGGEDFMKVNAFRFRRLLTWILEENGL